MIDGDGHGIGLGVEGYQFPEAVHPGKRQSWLVITGRACSPQGQWSFRWQALTTDEAIDLATWLRTVAASPHGSRRSLSGPEFTEPNLSFIASRPRPNLVALEVALDLEFSPPWRKRNRAGDPFKIECQLSPGAVTRAACVWGTEITPYPPWNRAH